MADFMAEQLPNIRDYPWQRRKDYLMLVAAMAAADNWLHVKESELLERWARDFGLTKTITDKVMEVAKGKPLRNQRTILKRLAQTDLTFSLMLDLMNMAMVDGVLMDDEINLLRGISKELLIDPMDFNILIEFVHSAYQASALDNPEPLYEHNINNAFTLLRKKHARLFQHTVLCVASEQCDLQIKARWFATGATQAS